MGALQGMGRPHLADVRGTADGPHLAGLWFPARTRRAEVWSRTRPVAYGHVMAITLVSTNEPCPRCGVNKVRNRSEFQAAGGFSIPKLSDPYCGNGCTRQQLDEFEREQLGQE